MHDGQGPDVNAEGDEAETYQPERCPECGVAFGGNGTALTPEGVCVRCVWLDGLHGSDG